MDLATTDVFEPTGSIHNVGAMVRSQRVKGVAS
jgi:hypothetical protein